MDRSRRVKVTVEGSRDDSQAKAVALETREHSVLPGRSLACSASRRGFRQADASRLVQDGIEGHSYACPREDGVMAYRFVNDEKGRQASAAVVKRRKELKKNRSRETELERMMRLLSAQRLPAPRACVGEMRIPARSPYRCASLRDDA